MKKGFTLVEILFAVGLAGVLLVTICGVFVHGLNAIEKGRIRSTALNLADRKISETHNLMKTIGRGAITVSGEDILKSFSDYTSIKYNGNTVSPSYACEKFWDPGNKLELEGKTYINGTAEYKYKYTLEDYLTSIDIKKVTIEVTWEDERVGSKKVYLESLVSKFQ